MAGRPRLYQPLSETRIRSVRIFVVGSFVVACSVVVARLPRAGESLDAAAFLSEPGGKGFNLAVAAHRLGAQVDGLFAIGDDPFAAVAEKAFRDAGLSTGMLVRRPGSTGAGVGFIDGAGENCIAVSLGANRLLDASDVDRVRSTVANADLVMATFESPDAPIRAAFARARARGARTLLNPSPCRPIDPALLAETSILVINRVEADDLGLDGAALAGSEGADAPAMAALMRDGPSTVVVTLGEDGAVAFRRDQPPCRQRAFPVAVRDTIGAGDAFAAGLAVSLMEDRPIQDALRRAAGCGALTALRVGAFDAFPSADALDRFLGSAAPDARAGA
ncbi:ribokinase [Methylobacterium sp. NEAU 140]|uniref:ribokinase n=1 Tax=Methylobacterium sp. NEAU 140 TaxID=3064945 RepID=UPI00273776EB|nr:ribokinase [Methylobacterium sp. NEAU 140]MDP4024912.1 ribokinase [Methylobacterium sp. NEAU 140]